MWKKDRTSKHKRPHWWGNFSVVMLILGPIFLAIAHVFFRPIGNLTDALVVSGGFLFNLLFILVIFISKTVGWHSYPLRHFINFGIISGFFCLGAGSVELANGALDPHPLEEHEVRVLNVPSACNSSGRGFLVEDWRSGHRGEELRLSNPPEGIRPGDHAIVVVGPGLLGMWLEEVRRIEAPSQ